MAVHVYRLYLYEENPRGHIVNIVRHGQRHSVSNPVSADEALEVALEDLTASGHRSVVAVIPMKADGHEYRVVTEGR